MTDAYNMQVRRDLRETNSQLATLNRELAGRLIYLAAQTEDVQSIVESVQLLSTAISLYTQTTTPPSHGELQKALGDLLLKIGRKEGRKDALEHAAIAYRGAITVASMLGENKLRAAAKKNYATTQSLLGRGKKRISAISAA